MAKGQQRSNKEIKKPKKVKTAPASVSPFEKGGTAAGLNPKKKG